VLKQAYDTFLSNASQEAVENSNKTLTISSLAPKTARVPFFCPATRGISAGRSPPAGYSFPGEVAIGGSFLGHSGTNSAEILAYFM
jgi:hypothetical protein